MPSPHLGKCPYRQCHGVQPSSSVRLLVRAHGSCHSVELTTRPYVTSTLAVPVAVPPPRTVKYRAVAVSVAGPGGPDAGTSTCHVTVTDEWAGTNRNPDDGCSWVAVQPAGASRVSCIGPIRKLPV